MTGTEATTGVVHALHEAVAVEEAIATEEGEGTVGPGVQSEIGSGIEVGNVGGAQVRICLSVPDICAELLDRSTRL